MRKFVAQICQRELQPITHNAGVGNRLGNITEQRRHLARRAQMSRIVAREQPSRPVQRRVMPDRCEHVEHLAVLLFRIAHAVGRNHRQAEALRSSEKANQSIGKFFQVLNRRRAFGLRRLAHLEARNQLAQILVAGLRRAQQHHARRLLGKLIRQPFRRREAAAQRRHRNLRANVRLHPARLSGRMKARCAVHAVPVGQRDRRHLQFHCALDQLLRQRRPGKKAECARRVQLNVFAVSRECPRSRLIPAARRCSRSGFGARLRSGRRPVRIVWMTDWRPR